MLVVSTKHEEGRVDVVGVGGPDHQVGLPSAQVVGDETDSLLCVVAAHAEVEDLGVRESALEYGRPGLLATHTEAPGEAVSNSEDPTNARPLGRWGHAGHPASDRISLGSDDLGVLQSWWVKDRPRRDLLLVDCVGRLDVLDDNDAHTAAHPQEEKSARPSHAHAHGHSIPRIGTLDTTQYTFTLGVCARGCSSSASTSTRRTSVPG